MSAMTFIINDQSTGGGVPAIQVTITENADGTLTFRIVQLLAAGNYLGDLRGFFFDINETLLRTLTVTSAFNTLASGVQVAASTAFSSSNDGVNSAGSSSNNMNGLLGSDGGFDFGIEIGTEGVGKNGDDVRGFEFTLDSSAGNLTLADFQDVNFGMRVMSVGLDTNGDGVIDTTRNGSVKVLENGVTVTGSNAAVRIDDDALANGNRDNAPGDDPDSVNATGTLAHDFGSGSGTIILTGIEFPCDLGLLATVTPGVITVTQYGIPVLRMTVNPATGAYSVEQLAAIEHANGDNENNVAFLIGYEARSSDGDIANGTLSVSVDDDSPLVRSSVATVGLSENSSAAPASQVTLSGQINFSGADAATAAVSTAAGDVTLVVTASDGTWSGSLDYAALRNAFSITPAGAWAYNASALDLEVLAVGDTITLTYLVIITDADGDQVSQPLTITLTGTNDAPTALADTNSGNEDSVISGSVATNDGDVDDGAVLSYALDAPVAGLTLNADGSYSFDATNAAYQHLAPGATEPVVASYTVSDGNGGSASATLTITLTGTNDAPTALADTNSGNEDSVISGSVATNDGDVDDGAVLSYALDAPVAGLTLNADGSYSFDATNAAYQHLAPGATEPVVASYTVSDGNGGSASATLTITLTGTNDAPTALADTNSGNEDSVISGSVATNDGDVDDGAVLSYALDAPVAGLTLNADGSYSFDATNAAYQHLAPGATEPVVASYTVSDGNGGSASATLTITLTGTNDAPTALADTNSGNEDSVISGSVATNDGDVDDGAVLSYALDAPVAGLTLNADGSYSFDATNAAYQHLAPGATEPVVASYTVSDGNGGSASATLTITLTGTNDAPTALADTNSGNEDSVISGSVATNDGDVDDGAVLSYALDAPVAGLTLNADGSYSFDATNAAYQHLAPGATEPVVASYTVSDGNGGSASATLTITLTGTNDAPTALADTNSGNEDSVISGSVATNDGDVDDGAVLSYALDAPVAGLTLNADGSYSFDATNAAYQHLAPGATEPVVASYTVSDGNGGSASATLTITLTGTNDAPTALADTNSGNEDSVISGSVATNDGDVDDGAVLSYALDAPVAGLTLNADGSYSFDATNAAYQHLAPGATEPVVASYTVSDGNGGSASATLTITLTGTNDAPTALADTNSGNEDSVISGSVATNDGDVDDGAVLSYALDAPVAGLTLNADGSYSFDATNAAYQHLAPGATEPVVASYTVSDGNGGSASATLTITLTGTNDAPTALADTNSGNEDSVISGSVATNDGDVDDGAVLSYALDAPVAGLTLNADGSYSFDATNAAYQHLAPGATEPVVASYTVSDGNGGSASATLTITLTGTNDAPTALADTNSGNEDSVISGSVATNDGDVDDGAVLSYALDAPVAGLTLNADGSYSFDATNAAYQHLAPGATEPVVASYTVSDGNGGSASATLTITLTGTNDAPTALADTNSGNEDSVISGSVATNDGDVDDGAVLSYALDAPVAGLTLNADGSYSFDATNAAYQHLAPGATEPVVASYTVSDGNGGSASATLTITLTGTNDAPTALADTNSGNEDSVISGSVATNDGDVDDGAVLSYALDAPVAGLTLNADGSYSFDATNAAYQHLAPGATEPVVASYTVSDGNGGSASATLTITLTGTNDAPTALADTNSGNEDSVISGSVATNDGDVDDGAVLSYALDAPVAGLTLNADGSYSFDATNAAYQHLAPGATEPVVASYTVSDGNGGSASATLTITLTGTNDAPTALADTNSGNEDSVISGSVATNDGDVDDGAVLSYALDAPVAGLTLNADGSYSFDATNAAYQHLAPGATEPVVASYTVSDGNGGSASATLTITLTGTNDAPTALADTNSGNEDSVISGSVATNDGDVDDGAVLSYALDAPVAGLTLNADGSYSFDATNAAYQHLAPGATEPVVASYTVSDGNGGSASATLTITLTGTNDAPTALADTNSGNEDSVISGSVATNDGDVDDGAVLSYALDAPVAGLTLNADGSYSFDATNAAYQHLAPGATEPVVASYTVSDGNGGSASATLTITLTGTNDAPTALADTNSGNEDSVISGSVATNDGDVDDGAVLSYALDAPVAGLTLNADGSYSFDATNAAYQHLAPGATEPVVASYTVSDGNGGSASATLTITLTGTNDAPTALADTNSGNEDSVISGSVATNDGDVDDGAVLSYALDAPVAGLTLNADGSYSFDATNAAYQHLAPGATEPVVASYTVSDGNGGSASATLTITLTGTNDAPTVGAVTSGSIAEVDQSSATILTGLSGTLYANDVDGDPLTYGIEGVTPVSGVASLVTTNGTLTVDTSSGAYSFTPVAGAFEGLDDGENPTLDLTLTVSDGTAPPVSQSYTIDLFGADDVPTLALIASGSIAEVPNSTSTTDSGLSGTLAGTDVDGETLIYGILGGSSGGINLVSMVGAYGTLTVNVVTGAYSYARNAAAIEALNAGQNPSDTFTVTVTDGDGALEAQNYTVNITGAHDASTAVDDRLVVSVGTAATFYATQLTGNDGTALAITGVFGTAVNNGRLTLNAATQTLTYAATTGVGAGADSFSYTLSDGSVGTVTFDVLNTNNGENINFTYGAAGSYQGSYLLIGNNGGQSLVGAGAVDTLVGANGGNMLTGNGGADILTGAGGADTFVIGSGASLALIGGSGNSGTISGYDVITDFVASGAGADRIDLVGAPAAAANVAGVNGIDSTLTINGSTVKSHTINSGMITFDDANSFASALVLTSMANVAAVVQYLQGNDLGNAGVSVAFTATINGTAHTFIYQQVGGTPNPATDVLVDLVGVTLTGATALAAIIPSRVFPAGIAGSAINLGLHNPIEGQDLFTVTIANVPAGWVLDGGVQLADGSWTIETSDLGAISVTCPTDSVGALILDIALSWINADGSVSELQIADNVETFAPGNPIFAWSGDDTLTGSAGADTFVFSQPIGEDTVHGFDVSADAIDLIGYSALASFEQLLARLESDANGNALISLADGQTITLQGVAASSLTGANFVFNVTPFVSNTGTMVIGDGALLPLSGTIDNVGTISLGSTGEATLLQLIQYGVTLQGGGNVLLSDNGANVIGGTLSGVTFDNVDNIISGAGQLGNGTLTLINGGAIIADGSNALVIDTGTNIIVNSGTIAATGSGGLVIASAIDNQGSIDIVGSHALLDGELFGDGDVHLSGDAMVEFGAGASVDLVLDQAATGLILFDDSIDFTGTIAGFNSDDRIELNDVDWTLETSLSYVANADGSGGVLTISDGTHTAHLEFVGNYSADGFTLGSDGDGGTLLGYGL